MRVASTAHYSPLDASSHGYVIAQAVELFTIRGAVGVFGIEDVLLRDGGARSAEQADLGLELLYALAQGDERVGKRVFDVVRVGDQDSLAVAVDDVRGHADDG